MNDIAKESQKLTDERTKLLREAILRRRTVTMNEDAIARPIIGIENRTAQEVFDIMVDRFRALDKSRSTEGDGLLREALDERQIAIRYMDALARQLAREGRFAETAILHAASNLLETGVLTNQSSGEITQSEDS